MPSKKPINVPEIVSDPSPLHGSGGQPIFSLKPGTGTEGFDFLSRVPHNIEPGAHMDDELVENVGSATRKSLQKRSEGKSLGEGAKSKIAQAEMTDVPRPTLAEELSKGDPQLAAELEKQQLSTAERMGLERRAEVERRIIEGQAPGGGPERRGVARRQGIEEIKRLKGELAADAARRANPGGRDTLVRNIPKIERRIAGARQSLIESAPGPSGRLAAKLGGKALGVAGVALNAVEHWRASNAVNTEENKDAPWMDRFAAYSERVLGMPSGASGRAQLPSEVRAGQSL